MTSNEDINDWLSTLNAIGVGTEQSASTSKAAIKDSFDFDSFLQNELQRVSQQSLSENESEEDRESEEGDRDSEEEEDDDVCDQNDDGRSDLNTIRYNNIMIVIIILSLL